MNKGTMIAYAIEKEVSRDSLTEWLEYWGITTKEFETFMKACVEKVNQMEAGEKCEKQ